ncbi:MAG: DUF3239 domain-containing protein [Planctomycetaceae bacterium]|nr:DUF3239 domain-containing protein [Planctomycetaceae bacterium]
MGAPQASNPGCVKVEFFKTYLRYHPFQKYLFLFLFLSVLPIFILFALHDVCVGLFFSVPYYIVVGLALYFRRNWVKDHFFEGDTNPGVVVSLNPMLIAVSADLVFNSPDEWPVIKIIRYELPMIAGKEPKLGTRVATVALYNGYLDRERLSNVYPIPVECATDNVKTQRRCLRQIPASDWQRLKEDLRYVPTPYYPGLYKIWEYWEED